MSPHVELKCPICSSGLYYDPLIVEAALRTYRMKNMYDVAQQMADKSGPAYDRWLAAMEARGKQKRCKDCTGGQRDQLGSYCDNVPHPYPTISLGQFACKTRFRPKGYE